MSVCPCVGTFAWNNSATGWRIFVNFILGISSQICRETQVLLKSNKQWQPRDLFWCEVIVHWRSSAVVASHSDIIIDFYSFELRGSYLRKIKTCDRNVWHFLGTFRGMNFCTYIKVKWSRYRPGVAQSVGRSIALRFHDRGTRRGWVVSSTTGRTLPRERPGTHFTVGWVVYTYIDCECPYRLFELDN